MVVMSLYGRWLWCCGRDGMVVIVVVWSYGSVRCTGMIVVVMTMVVILFDNDGDSGDDGGCEGSDAVLWCKYSEVLLVL